MKPFTLFTDVSSGVKLQFEHISDVFIYTINVPGYIPTHIPSFGIAFSTFVEAVKYFRGGLRRA